MKGGQKLERTLAASRGFCEATSARKEIIPLARRTRERSATLETAPA
jgi:hypothetical protein